MPRTLVFWEKKLEEAEMLLGRYLAARDSLHIKLSYSIKRSRKGTAEQRLLRRYGAESLRGQFARLERRISKLSMTKIPYYREQIMKGPKTTWEYLRSEGLRL